MNGDINEKQVLVGEVSGPASVDKSLKKEGLAADAAEVGRRLKAIEERLNALNPVTAKNLGYDNSASGLEAKNVQSAIDEVSGKVTDAVSEVDKGLEGALKEIDEKMGDYLKVTDKPSGSYIGNGSLAQRIIDIKGKGNVLMIYAESSALSSKVFLFATPVGVVGHAGSMAVTVSSGYFENGILTISSASEYINKKDVEYYYQVL